MENKKIVLVVDDEESLRDLIVKKLTDFGFEVFAAKNGEEGFALAEKEKPDLIFLDVLMPKMDGVTTMKKIRSTEWGEKLPIIILTVVVPDDKMMAEIVNNEPAFYLLKTDWKIEELIEKAKVALGIE